MRIHRDKPATAGTVLLICGLVSVATAGSPAGRPLSVGLDVPEAIVSGVNPTNGHLLASLHASDGMQFDFVDVNPVDGGRRVLGTFGQAGSGYHTSFDRLSLGSVSFDGALFAGCLNAASEARKADGKIDVSARVVIVDLATGREIASPTTNLHGIACAWLDNGKLAIVARGTDADIAAVRLFDVASGSLTELWREPGGDFIEGIVSVAPNKLGLLVGRSPVSLRLLELVDGKLQVRTLVDKISKYSVDFVVSTDGRYVVFNNHDSLGPCRVIDTINGRRVTLDADARAVRPLAWDAPRNQLYVQLQDQPGGGPTRVLTYAIDQLKDSFK
jgi:hypothetical protein